MSSRTAKRVTGALAIILAGSLALTGCGGDSATGGLLVSTLTANPSAMDTGATTVVEAVVRENGAVVADRVVTFTVSPTSAGFFTPSVDTSDASGLVATVFTSTTSGSATISASVTGGTGATTPVTINAAQQTGSGNLTMNLSNSLLLADGASASTVTVTVRDALSNLAPDGTIVRLTSGEKFVDVDGNGYWTAGIDSLVFDSDGDGVWDAIGSITATAVVAGGAGQVAVTFTAGSVAATAYIKASVDDGVYSGEIESTIQLTPNAVVNSIFLDADTIHLAVRQTGGFETSTLRAWCYDENGNSIPEGITVTFVITDGPAGGENIANLGWGPYTAITNAQGVAIAPISSGTASGTIRFRASSGTVLSNATQIMVNAGPPVEISVGVDTCNTRMWRIVNGRIGVTAVVRDLYRNPVSDSTAVYFTTDEGQVIAQQGATRDASGVAETEWISGYDVTGHDGTIWVYAETSGGTVRDSVAFINSDMVATIALSGFPNSLIVDGEDNAHYSILLFDLNGNPVINGMDVGHRESFVTITTELSENQCFGSFARGTIKRFGPLTRDYVLSPGVDDGIGAVDLVTFFVENGSLTVPCTLLTGSSYSKNSSIDDLPSTFDEGQSSPFNATIHDRFGNPLGNHVLVAAASAGTIANTTLTTNLYGEVYGFNFTAPIDPLIDKVTISVADTDPRGNGLIMVSTVTIIH
ncbi:MAG: hypothetical protein ACE5GA_05855 [Candidatus Zixiibacteriota bacterium]